MGTETIPQTDIESLEDLVTDEDTQAAEQDFARVLLATDDVPEDYIAAIVKLRQQQNDLENIEIEVDELASRLTYANQVLLAIVKYKGADQFVPVTLALAAVSEYLPEDYA